MHIVPSPPGVADPPRNLEPISRTGVVNGGCALSAGNRILLLGTDFHLLRQRLSALVVIGADAVISGPAELDSHVGGESFNVLVLCHTLSDLERRKAILSAHRRWPTVKILQLADSMISVGSSECVLRDDTPDDPPAIAQRALAMAAGR